MPITMKVKPVKDLLADLDFPEEGVLDALQSQPALAFEAGKFWVKKLRERMAAEARLEVLKVEAAEEFREAEDAAGNKPPTVQRVAEKVAAHESVKKAQHEANEAKAAEQLAKVLYGAYGERGSMAKAIVQLAGAEAAKEAGLLRAELDRMGFGTLRDKVERQMLGS